MAYKRTGRPAGRPKTKEYVSLQARVPAELADLVKRYAAQHGRIPLSALIRDGLEWRIGDGDPRGMGMYLEESTGTGEKTYYGNTETASSLDSSAVLADMQAALARQETQIHALTQMLEQQTTLMRSNVYSSNTEKAPSVTGETATKVKADKALVEARIHQLRDQGVSYAKIAVQLQAEGIPTISGRGKWGKGNVERIAKGEAQSVSG